MSTLLYLVTIILLIGWSLGYFVYSAGSVVHTLLIMAVITILLTIIRGKRPI
ncbi:MAG: lmo0937 family membrane protein [Chitinophagaceae bacterium]